MTVSLGYFWLVLAHLINEYLLFSIKGFVGRIISTRTRNTEGNRKGKLLECLRSASVSIRSEKLYKKIGNKKIDLIFLSEMKLC